MENIPEDIEIVETEERLYNLFHCWSNNCAYARQPYTFKCHTLDILLFHIVKGISLLIVEWHTLWGAEEKHRGGRAKKKIRNLYGRKGKFKEAHNMEDITN